MISGHYWPHLAVDSAGRDVRLAGALARAGLTVEVLTPRYAASWPEELRHREIPIHRPVAAARNQWSIGRYLKYLEAWLTQHARRFDVLFCTSLREEVIAVTRSAARRPIRTVLQHSGTAGAADHLAWPSLRYGRRLRASLAEADAIVVSWASVQRDLVALGVPPKRLHRIDIGVSAGAAPVRDPLRKGADLLKSRLALAAVNRDLALDRDSLVVLAGGQMNHISGMLTLAEAMTRLIDHWPDLRLWLIGDGEQRDELHGYLRYHGIRQNVAMPGTFVDFEDLFRVADVVVIPSPADALEEMLPAAVGAAVPLVVADAADSRAYLSGQEASVGWFSPGDSAGLQAAIHAALVDLPARRAAAQRLRRELLRRNPYDVTIARYKQLFDSLAAASAQQDAAAAAWRSPADH